MKRIFRGLKGVFTRLSAPVQHGYIRILQEQIIDRADAIRRRFTGQGHLPPYTLRLWTGSASNFTDVGPWMLKEFKKKGLIKPGDQVLDVGCGAGRIALAFAMDPDLKHRVRYTGMEVDRKSVKWCQENISPKNQNFTFYRADLYSQTYNPRGKIKASDFAFPHPDCDFDFILLTSVFTHLLPEDAAHYLRELFRILKPEGRIYASFFIYDTESEAVNGVPRRPYRFKFYRNHYALVDETVPEVAVAYRRDWLLQLASQSGLTLKMPIQEDFQDALVLGREAR